MLIAAGFSGLALLQKGVYQLKGDHSHRHVHRLDHQPGIGVTVTASQELLQELPPPLVTDELALLGATQQGPLFGTQANDHDLEIYALCSHLARVTTGV
jgi:hypothetical protein